MRKWLTILSMILLTPSLLLLSSRCSEGRDEDSNSFGAVGGIVDLGCSAQSDRKLKVARTMATAGRQVVCSTSTSLDQMVLMFQHLNGNSTRQELAGDCSELRLGSHGEEKGIDNIHVLSSEPINIPDRPKIQLSFYDWHGDITPTNLSDYYLTVNDWKHGASAIFCTLSSYEATDKMGARKTRATIHCSLRKRSQAVSETVPSSTYMTHCIYKTIQEVVKLISFYQRGNSFCTYEVSGLDIITLHLTSDHLRQGIVGQFQMTATLSFSTSLQHFRVLTVAVLVRSAFSKVLANMGHDESHMEPHLKGFSVDVFKAAVAVFPKRFAYKLVPFHGSCDELVKEVARKVCISSSFQVFLFSCDELVKEVARKTFHAALGGILITAGRSHLVEFSQPYAELELVMVVKKQANEMKKVLWFMSPFTRDMWLTMAAMTVFTGFVIWLIEHTTENETPSLQVESAFFCYPLAFFLNEHRPRNILSFYVLVPWLILTFIVTTTFTASLSSMVTSSQAEPSDLNVDSLKKINAAIASDGNSFTVSYLVKSLGFKRKNLRNISSVDDCAKALSSGNVKAAFLLTPDAKVFLGKYCRVFAKSGPAYNLGDFGFVFPRSSALASDMSEALLNLKEAGKLQQMEEDMLSFSTCSSSISSDETDSRGIGPGSFSGLFILSGGASAAALLITVIRILKRRWEIQRMFMGRGLWVWFPILFSRNQMRKELQLTRIRSNY